MWFYALIRDWQDQVVSPCFSFCSRYGRLYSRCNNLKYTVNFGSSTILPAM